MKIKGNPFLTNMRLFVDSFFSMVISPSQTLKLLKSVFEE